MSFSGPVPILTDKISIPSRAPMYMPSGSQFGIFLEVTFAGAFECIGGFVAFILCSRVARKELQLFLQTTIMLLFIAAILLKHFDEHEATGWVVFVCR